MGSQGQATEEEKRLTMMLFSGIFDSLAQRVSLKWDRSQVLQNAKFRTVQRLSEQAGKDKVIF